MTRSPKAPHEAFAAAFGEMKMPKAPDLDALMATHRRNLEVLAEANRLAMEGAQAMFKRQAELAQQAMGAFTDGLQELSKAEAPGARAARQAKLMKEAYDRTVRNSQEMMDLIRRANADALNLLNKRIGEAMEEVETLLAKAGS
ncbi:MAG: phasin family protein [Rhodospirillales bacterium]|nr:phasin family protein [Rhodospirillales bacterium]